MTSEETPATPLADRHTRYATRLLTALVLAGLCLRLAQYFHNRELWLDEAWLAYEFLNHSLVDMTRPLVSQLNFPIGFLLIEKFATMVAGASEYVLRFFPLLCGAGALLAITPVAMRVGGTQRPADWATAMLVVAFLVFNKHAIYYASEARQYSTDLFATCFLLLLAGAQNFAPDSESLAIRRAARMGAVGVLIVWFSWTSIFTLAAIFVVQGACHLSRRQWRAAIAVAVGLALSGLSFWLHLQVIERNMDAQGTAESVHEYVRYMSEGIPPRSWSDVPKFFGTLERFLYNPGGMSYPAVAVIACLLGCVDLWKRRRGTLLVMVLPFVFVLAAAVLGRYAFRDRFLVFLLPQFFIVMSCGVGLLLRQKAYPWRIGGCLLLVLLIARPAVQSGRVLFEARTGPGGGSEVKVLLNSVREEWQAGDILFVHGSEAYQFLYYNREDGLDPAHYRLDKFPTVPFFKPEKPPFQLDLSGFTNSGNRRVWVLYRSGGQSQLEVEQALAQAGLSQTPMHRTVSASGDALALYAVN